MAAEVVRALLAAMDDDLRAARRRLFLLAGPHCAFSVGWNPTLGSRHCRSAAARILKIALWSDGTIPPETDDIGELFATLGATHPLRTALEPLAVFAAGPWVKSDPTAESGWTAQDTGFIEAMTAWYAVVERAAKVVRAAAT